MTSRVLWICLAFSVCAIASDARVAPQSQPRTLSRTQFVALMRTVEDGWNRNDARRAADCFAEDALYSSPPDARIRRGRAALYEFFGGERGRPRPMHMTWHHLVFDEETQIGMGEYTFEYEVRTHGIVIVRMVDGRIANWREYEHASPLTWEAMVGDNRF
jgi:ketosteroid isomerase-like protein